VEYVFGNPGTTESGLLDGLLDAPALNYVTCLHESVALGAAHYYAQATGRTSFVNLHVAPGLGNALGMLYNAAEAGSPMVVTAGQQDTRMRLREPLLSGDLVAMAAPLVKWSVQAERADELGHLLQRAFKVAQDPPSGPVFVALPIDVLEQETLSPALGPAQLLRGAAAQPSAISRLADLLIGCQRPAFVVGDAVARSGGRAVLVELAELLGATVHPDGLVHHVHFPPAHPLARPRMPLDYAGIRRVLEGVDLVLLLGGNFFEEIWFDEGSPFPKGAQVAQIEGSPDRLGLNFSPDLGILAEPALALQALVAELRGRTGLWREAAEQRFDERRAERAADEASRSERQAQRSGAANLPVAQMVGQVVASLPENVVLVNEGITASGELLSRLPYADAESVEERYYGTRGGGIGQGLPGGLGAALAHPGRPVLAVSGDGSAMYSSQALWTAAHLRLPILFLIVDNREYRILKINMQIYRQRFGVPSDRPFPHMDLGEPVLDFVGLAAAHGVAGWRAEDVEQLDRALGAAWKCVAEGSPALVEVRVRGQSG
jgi:benzoylformate decarboxylase